jgi:hypothetical protein
MPSCFIPSCISGLARNCRSLCGGQFLRSCSATFLSSQAPMFDRGRVFAIGLALGQFGGTRGYVHDELRELVDVSGAFAFWHGYSMP